MSNPDANETVKLDKYGKRGIAVNFFFILLSLPFLLISAGKIIWINGWLYFGLILAYEFVYISILIRMNPELLNERGKFVKEGTKPFDRVYAAVYLPLSYLILIISGLDAVRYEWSTMSLWITLLGLIIVILAFCFSLWAIAVNSYFECTVRIQRDRKQKVVTDGPYRIVRHPGYAAGIVSVLAAPLILGSWLGLVPSILISIILVIRTALEDNTLQKELDGYNKYSKMTRFRLLPFIW